MTQAIPLAAPPPTSGHLSECAKIKIQPNDLDPVEQTPKLLPYSAAFSKSPVVKRHTHVKKLLTSRIDEAVVEDFCGMLLLIGGGLRVIEYLPNVFKGCYIEAYGCKVEIEDFTP